MKEMETHERIATRITTVSSTIHSMEAAIDQLADMLSMAKREMAHLQQAYRRLGRDRHAQFTRIPVARETAPRAKRRMSGQVTHNRVKKVISDAFVSWCKKGDAMIHKYRHFEKVLQQSLPGASVQRIYRDAASPAVPVVFQEKEGLKQPAEFWMIASAYEKTLFLLPQPIEPDNFSECDRVFIGSTLKPCQLHEIEPAVVHKESQYIVLSQTGQFIDT